MTWMNHGEQGRPPAVTLAIALTMVAAVTVGAAGAAEYVIAKESGSRVVFTSKAPMETIDGKTEYVSGRLDVDLAQLTGPLAMGSSERTPAPSQGS